MNGWMRHFEIMTIIGTIASAKAMINGMPVISFAWWCDGPRLAAGHATATFHTL